MRGYTTQRNDGVVEAVVALSLMLAISVLQTVVMPRFAVGFVCGYSGVGCSLIPAAANFANWAVGSGATMAWSGYFTGNGRLFWAGVGLVGLGVAVA
ncbi:MAG: hypothetical protein ACP5MH_11315 [Thermoproteus sp.]